MIITSKFKPAWWLATSHAQTVYPTLFRHTKPPTTHPERLELPDGDFVDLAWAVNGLSADAPLIILLHGLGGSIKSGYIAGLMHVLNKRGWRVVLMHFRGASGVPNRLPRSYHSGDTADFNFFMNELMAREPTTRKAAVGFSLGGNVLLKWLGEQGEKAGINTAVAVSVPLELRAASDRMSKGFSRVYQGYLLRRIRQAFAKKRPHLTHEIPQPLLNMNKWQCFWTFDDNVTAPMYGFQSAHEYYRQSSSRAYLHAIERPTLIIHALDDPFMTTAVLPDEHELSHHVTFELSAKGGHVGFVSGNVPGKPVYWLEQRIPAYIEKYLI